jgi:branched-chain amino acid transport system substrate-binding protein
MRLANVLGALGAISLLTASVGTMSAEMRGVTATEIRIGQTMPYSGPVSAFGALGKGEVGYFRMINERGDLA